MPLCLFSSTGSSCSVRGVEGRRVCSVPRTPKTWPHGTERHFSGLQSVTQVKTSDTFTLRPSCLGTQLTQPCPPQSRKPLRAWKCSEEEPWHRST